MKVEQFKTFLASAQFDDKATRSIRAQDDKLSQISAIRDMFNSFVKKCNSLYNPSPFVCVNETLVGFRGLEVWSLCDCGTNYAYNLQVYLGKQGESPEQQQREQVVKDVTEGLFDSGCNITTDSFFTPLSLAQFLFSEQLTRQ